MHLLERFVQDGRVHISRPRTHQQMQFNRALSPGNGFVSFIDAIGELDGITLRAGVEDFCERDTQKNLPA